MFVKRNTKKAFTLVELVVVIAVIAILAAVLLPSFSSIIEKATYSKAKQNCINKYKNDIIEQNSLGIYTFEDYYFYYESDGYYFSNKDKELIQIPKEEYDSIIKKSNPLNWEGKIVSILGDSISTFEGYNPTADGTNLNHRVRYSLSGASWYFESGGTVNDTYWMKLISDTNATLGINDSWAGSRVSNDQDTNSGDLGPDSCMASLTRIKNLGSNGTPDIIIYYGGTNDIGGNVPVGFFDKKLNYELDLSKDKWSDFSSAYKDSIMRLKYYYPNAKIIALLPTYTVSYYSQERLNQYNAIMKTICDYFDVLSIDLTKCGINMSNISKYLGDGIHPTKEGFDLIEEYIKQVILTGSTENPTIEEENGENETIYYNKLPSLLPTSSVNIDGYGWADGESVNLIGKEINVISFYSNNTSGFIEIGISRNLNGSIDNIRNISIINWTSSDKNGNIVTVYLNSSITLNVGEYIVIYPETKPESGAFLYYSSANGCSFYSDAPLSRRGRNPWNLCSNLSLGIRYGYRNK